MFVFVHSNCSSAKAELEISTIFCYYNSGVSQFKLWGTNKRIIPLVSACDFRGEQDRGRDSLKYTKFPAASICCQSCEGPSLPPSFPSFSPPSSYLPFPPFPSAPLMASASEPKNFLPIYGCSQVNFSEFLAQNSVS